MEPMTLSTIAGGALEELFGAELTRVLANIQDVNTDPKAKRVITFRLEFAPAEDREMTDIKVSCASPNPVTLAPYRTFREIAQPESQFVFRLRGGVEGALPHAALFEADGAEWKLAAVGRIASFLRRALHDTHMAKVAILA